MNPIHHSEIISQAHNLLQLSGLVKLDKIEVQTKYLQQYAGKTRIFWTFYSTIYQNREHVFTGKAQKSFRQPILRESPQSS